MAIKLPDGRIMRTLPEQVDKNMQDIELLMNKGLLTAQVVDELPETGEPNVIYFVPSEDPSEQNVYDEYMWRDDAWEMVGKSTIDLSNYVTLDSEQEITGSKTFTQTITSSTGNDIISYSLGSYFIKLDGNGQPNIGQNNNDIRFYGSNIRVSSPVLRPQNNRATDLGDDSYSFNEAHIKELIFPAGETSYISVGGSHELSINTTNLLCDVHVLPWGNNLFSLGEPNNKWRNLYLANELTDGTNSVTVAQISKTKLYLHTLTVSNITPPVCVVLNSNVALSGSVGSNLGPRMIVTAYLASNYVSLLKTPNGSLVQINSDLTLSVAVSSGETITADTVTEL